MNFIIFFIAIYFTILYSWAYRSDKSSDFLSPVKFISLLFFIKNVPYLFMVSFDEGNFNQRVYRYLQLFTDKTLDEAFLKYAIINTIAFLCLVIGLKTSRKLNFQLKPNIQKYDNKFFSYAINTSFIIGFLGYINFISNIGGLQFLIENLNDRVNLQSGQYFLKLRPLMAFSCVFSYILWLNNKNDFRKKFRFYIFLIVSLLVFSSTGGRKSSIYLLIILLTSYYYYSPYFKLKKIINTRNLILSSFLIFYVFFIPALRSTSDSDYSEFNDDLIENIGVNKFIKTISYVYIDVYTVNHFDLSNTWDFKSLLTIPSNIFDRKSSNLRPPIDEGRYFSTSIETGGNYTPLIPRQDLREFSFPVENMGFSYANGLLLGVVVFFFLQGKVISFFYNSFVKYSSNPFLFYIYVFVVLNFNFSSLRIINLITTALLLSITFLIYKFYRNF